MYLRRNSRGALRAPVEVRGKVHTAEAAAAPAAAGSVSEENFFLTLNEKIFKR